MTLTGDTLRLVAHRLDGSTLESCGFAQGHPWDCDAQPKTEGSSEVPPAPVDTSPSSSKCGCSLPGVPVGFAPGAAFALVAAGVAARRRRRG